MRTENLSCSPYSDLLEDPKLHFVPWVHQNQAELLTALPPPALLQAFPLGHAGTSKRVQGRTGLTPFSFMLFLCLFSFWGFSEPHVTSEFWLLGLWDGSMGGSTHTTRPSTCVNRPKRMACICSPVTGREGRGKGESAGAYRLPA